MDWNALETARRLFGELEGGPRFWWGKNDRSLIVDANNQYLVHNGLGWMLDGDRRLGELDDPASIEYVTLDETGSKEPKYHDIGIIYDNRLDYWLAEGLTEETIKHFGLGHFLNIWIALTISDCWAIPIKKGEETVQIKYRIEDWPGGEPLKYRVLPPTPKVEPFWALQEGKLYAEGRDLLLVGGEKKAMRLWQEGFDALSSTAGILALPDAWLDIINRFGKVYIVFDPSEQWAAALHAKSIGPKAWVVWLPGGLDAFWANGGTAEQLRNELGQARPLGALTTSVLVLR